MNSRLVIKAILIGSLLLFHTVFSEIRDSIGDINNDGVINVQDIVRIVNIILQNDLPPTEYEQWAGDVNNDDIIDVTDIIIIVNYILGTGILCDEGYSFCPGSITECCADLTSHYLEWAIDTLGALGLYSDLFDAAIINDSVTWVVGAIYLNGEFYNAASWDGENWEMHQIAGSNSEFRGIFAFSEEDIWMTPAIPIHFEDGEWVVYNLWQMGILGQEDGPLTKIWGVSPSDVYFIGNLGTIVHYDGSEFSRIESGTNVNLYSITGSGPNDVWISGENLSIGENRTTLLHYDGMNVEIILEGPASSEYEDNMISGAIKGVYTDIADSIWVTTHLGMYKCASSTTGEGELLSGSENWGASINTISGNTHNDIFIAGDFSTIWHYNGIGFHQYEELLYESQTWGIVTDQNTVCAVGFLATTAQALILIGNR